MTFQTFEYKSMQILIIFGNKRAEMAHGSLLAEALYFVNKRATAKAHGKSYNRPGIHAVIV